MLGDRLAGPVIRGRVALRSAVRLLARASAASCEALESRLLFSHYFVSPYGNDHNPGTEARPWLSITRVDHELLLPGDTISFFAGATFSGNLVVRESGTPLKPITFTSYGFGRATINAGNGDGIIVHDHSGIQISRLNFIGTSQTQSQPDGSTLTRHALTGYAAVHVADPAGITPGQPINIDRGGANFETAYVAAGYERGSTVVPLDAPLRFPHAAGASVRWDVHAGIAFVADDGISHNSGVRIDHVDVHGFGGIWGSAGISIAGNTTGSAFSDIDIHRSDVHDNGPNGVYVWGFPTDSAQHLHVSIVRVAAYSNAFSDAGRAAASAALNVPNNPSGHSSESGINVFDAQGLTIDHCLAYDNGKFGSGGAGIWAARSDDCLIQYCESYDNHAPGVTDGDGFDLDLGITNSVVQYNYSHDNDGAGFLIYEPHSRVGIAAPNQNNVLRFNISSNDARKNGYGGISIGNDIRNDASQLSGEQIYNNTVYTPASSGVIESSAFLVMGSGLLEGMAVRNNIFMTTGDTAQISVGAGTDLRGAGNVFQGNDYWEAGSAPNALNIVWSSTGTDGVVQWSRYRTLGDWQVDTGQEMLAGVSTALNENPRFYDLPAAGTIGDTDRLPTLAAFRLDADSPLRHAGLGLAKLFGIDDGGFDFYGNALPDGARLDIGANAIDGMLPAPWISGAVGRATPPPVASYSSATQAYTLASPASSSIGGASDSAPYIYQALTGDGTITVQLNLNGSTALKAGLMIRNSLDPTAAEASLLLGPGGVSFQYRSDAGGGGATRTAVSAHWLRLKRHGDTVIGLVSNDGVSWTEVSRATLSPDATMLVGLTVTSTPGSRTPAVFRNPLVQQP